MLKMETIHVTASAGDDRSRTIIGMAEIAYEKQTTVICSFNGKDLTVTREDVSEFTAEIHSRSEPSDD